MNHTNAANNAGKKVPAPDYSKERNRLNRVLGQIEGIKKMISDQRDCKDILSQLRAVRSAIHSVESDILKTYLEYCINESLLTGSEEKKKEKIDEISTLYAKFSK